MSEQKEQSAGPITAERPNKNLSFGLALEALKDGFAVAREGWNGKNMFVFLNKGSVDWQSREETPGYTENSEEQGFVEGIKFDLFDNGDAGTITRLPNINMRAATGSTVTGWLASQTDLLAEDWCILQPGNSLG